MATTEIAAIPEINDDVMSRLCDMAGHVVDDYSTGFNWRAEATRAEFFEDPADLKWIDPARHTAGQLYADCDYAFIELMRPDRRAALAASFEEANAYRAAHYGERNCDALPIDVQSAIRVANLVLDAVAREQPADRLLETDGAGGFWEDFMNEIFAFYDSGDITDRS